MSLAKQYFIASYKLLGDYIEDFQSLFSDVGQSLSKAGLKYTLVEYVSGAVLASFITFFVLNFVLGLAVMLAAFSFTGFLFSFVISFIVSMIVLVSILYIIPNQMISANAELVDGYLPYAVLHMRAIAGGNVPPAVMFKVLSNFKEYSRLSDEFDKIVDDSEVAGYDIITALNRAVKRAPSESLRKLFMGIASVIESGADLGAYLKAENEVYMKMLRRKEAEYSELVVGLFAEIYMIFFGVVPLLISIMFAVMSVLRNVAFGSMSMIDFQKVIAFVVIPIATVLYIMLLDSVRPVHMRVR